MKGRSNMLDWIWEAFEKTGDIQVYLLYKTFEQAYDEGSFIMFTEYENENTHPLC